MELEDKKFKHLCKFCNKSFPCGRSLGGHIRSHMINNNNSPETEHKLTKKKLSSPVKFGANNNNSSTETCLEAGIHSGYILRENPKKTWRLAGSSEDTSPIHDKFCKECGKGFRSWKTLFRHMKCHSEKDRASSLEEEQDSWISANQKLVMDYQSDNETAAPNRRRRSKRRTRYIGTAANSCSFSLVNNGSSSVSDIEQEQEEVAQCLMMLSKDVGNWVGLNSIAESSDNNSVFLKAKIDVKCNNGNQNVKSKKLKEKKFESSTVDSENCQNERKRDLELSTSGFSRNGSKKLNKNEDGFPKKNIVKKFELDDQSGFENSEVELGKENRLAQAQLGSSMFNSSKRRFRDSNDPELKSSDPLRRVSKEVLDSEFCKDSLKRSKFECTTCNRIFHSYQALGGHRASHKKIKGCFASRIDSSENSIETELSPDQITADSKLIKSTNKQKIHIVDHLVADCDDKTETKKSKGHECPICFKVFPSGQALGGHKRSHLLGGNEAKTNKTIVIEKPIPEIRGFLDLNLPAPVEEETNPQVGFKPWWLGSSHKQKALVGLISN